MGDVAVAVLEGVLLQEARVIAGILQIVAGGCAAQHDLGAQVGQLFLIEDDEGIQGGLQHGQDVVVADAADVVAAHAGDLGSAIEQLGGGFTGERVGGEILLVDQIQLEGAGHVGRIGFVDHNAFLGQHVRSLVGRIVVDVGQRQRFHAGQLHGGDNGLLNAQRLGGDGLLAQRSQRVVEGFNGDGFFEGGNVVILGQVLRRAIFLSKGRGAGQRERQDENQAQDLGGSVHGFFLLGILPGCG